MCAAVSVRREERPVRSSVGVVVESVESAESAGSWDHRSERGWWLRTEVLWLL